MPRSRARRWLVLVAVAGCSGERERRAPAGPASSALVVTGSAAAGSLDAPAAFAKTFKPELVGDLSPKVPVAGDYAMSLAMRFETFPSMEMRVDERRTGAVRVTLADDGEARACLGARERRSVLGQFKYEPPERRQHREHEAARLLALAGKWQNAAGVVTIAFDRAAWGTCDLAQANQLPAPLTELRCVAVDSTPLLPVGGLACEAGKQSELLGLGIPLAGASPRGAPDAAPKGANLMLGAPGVAVTVTQRARASSPAITFKADVVTLAEADYQPKKK
jgi:hypothetical protein